MPSSLQFLRTALIAAVAFLGLLIAPDRVLAIPDTIDDAAPKPVAVNAFGGASDSGALTVVDSAVNRINASKGLQPLGDNAFGESYDPASWNLSFLVTDVRLEGTGPAIEISRSLNVRASASAWWARERAFADWDLELPRLTTKTPHPALQAPWQVGGANPSARCTNFGIARNVTINGFEHQASEWWEGVQLAIPGKGTQEVMFRSPQNPAAPTLQVAGTNGWYPLVTSQHWALACLPQTSNGAAGEGFLAVSPSGDKYWFDHLVTGGWDWYALPQAIPYAMYRYDASLLPSRIEDRFGNWLDFTYDGPRLTGITSSDGRAVSVTWQSVNGLAFITQVTEQPGDPRQRSWNYAYQTPNTGRTLNTVTLPDQSAWVYSFEKMTRYCLWWQPDAQSAWCDDNVGNLGPNVGTATAPSGLVGTFTVQGGEGTRLLLPQYVTLDCMHEGPGANEGYFVVVMTSKTYSGAGLTPATWTPTNACPYPGCVSTIPNTMISGMIDPQGRRTLNHVDIAWCGPHYGEVLRTDIGAVLDGQNNIVSTARSTVMQHAASDAGPYPSRVGLVPQAYANRRQLEYLYPLKQRTITQDGATFTWAANTFDTFARPVQVVRSSTVAESRTETSTYFDHPATWTLGQVGSVTESSTGAVMFGQTFDPVSGNVLTQSQYGKLVQTLGFNPDGTVDTIQDGKNQTTYYQSYKRGIPQTVVQADNVSISAAVNNLGQIESTTDGTQFTTSYLYDPLGRLGTTTYPGGDQVAWAPETLVYERVQSTEYGITGMHWRQTTSRGNYRHVTYFDGRWQPILTREYDQLDPMGTDRWVARNYDYAGRQTFESYPVDNVATWAAVTAGHRTEYDVLGRVTRREQDSEIGELATVLTYSAPFKLQVTSPKNLSTTTTFFALDEPAYDAPLITLAPEGITSAVVRDVFGKPKSITRSGTWNNAPLSATRSFVYDAHQKLCKAIEADAGTTVMEYDENGLLWWQATGLDLPATNTCNRAEVLAANRSMFTYDANHRLKNVDHPSGTNDVAYTYYDDGSLYTAAAGGTTWTYTYNKRRLLESESLAVDGKTFALDWNYDPLGSVASLGYPSGLSVPYTPNVFGEPRQAGTYATDVTYFPNGRVDTLAYGNGASRDVTPNARGLPERIRDASPAGVLLDQTLGYDSHGNLISIVDGIPGGQESRTLWYDGRDRLVDVTGAPLGTEHYSYDPLDNVRSALTNGFDRRMHYHAATGRLERTSDANGATEVSYAWNSRGEMTGRSSPVPTAPLTANAIFRHGFESVEMVWDAARHLVNFMGAESYTYDAFDHRVKSVGSGNATRYQVYSRGGQLMYVEDAGRNQRLDFIYLDNQLVAQRWRAIASDNPVTTTYLHSDLRGTPASHSGANGGLTLRNLLKPFGEPYSEIYQQMLGLSDHAVDEVSELIYMQNRYYDPLSQRFVSTDPVVPSQDGFNEYVYANNNPYTFVDSDGLWACLGSDPECSKFEVALGRVEVAACSNQLSGSERSVLLHVMDFYGAKGDPRVTIGFGTLGGPGGTAELRADGGSHITLDLVRAERKGNDDRTLHVLARVVAHEGQHGLNDQARNRPVVTRDERTAEEVSGYTAQAYYQKAMRFVDSARDGWTPWTGLSLDNIETQAKQSVERACGPVREGSCK